METIKKVQPKLNFKNAPATVKKATKNPKSWRKIQWYLLIRSPFLKNSSITVNYATARKEFGFVYRDDHEYFDDFFHWLYSCTKSSYCPKKFDVNGHGVSRQYKINAEIFQTAHTDNCNNKVLDKLEANPTFKNITVGDHIYWCTPNDDRWYNEIQNTPKKDAKLLLPEYKWDIDITSAMPTLLNFKAQQICIATKPAYFYEMNFEVSRFLDNKNLQNHLIAEYGLPKNEAKKIINSGYNGSHLSAYSDCFEDIDYDIVKKIIADPEIIKLKKEARLRIELFVEAGLIDKNLSYNDKVKRNAEIYRLEERMVMNKFIKFAQLLNKKVILMHDGLKMVEKFSPEEIELLQKEISSQVKISLKTTKIYEFDEPEEIAKKEETKSDKSNIGTPTKGGCSSVLGVSEVYNINGVPSFFDKFDGLRQRFKKIMNST